MEGSSRNGEISPKLLHLIPQGRRNWFHHEKASVYNTEEKNLELKLGPPGEDEDEDGSSLTRRFKKEQKDKSILSLAGNHHFSPSITTNKPTSQKRFKTILFFSPRPFDFTSLIFVFICFVSFWHDDIYLKLTNQKLLFHVCLKIRSQSFYFTHVQVWLSSLFHVCLRSSHFCIICFCRFAALVSFFFSDYS